MKRHLSLGLGALLALSAALVAPTATAPPAEAATTTTYKVVQANIGSGSDNVDLGVADKKFDGFGTVENPLKSLEDAIAQESPDFVAVQEACTRDYDRMVARHADQYSFSPLSVMISKVSSNPCTDSSKFGAVEDKGTFIMSRRTITGTTDTTLPAVPVTDADVANGTRRSRRHALLCVDAGGPVGPTKMCTVHLTAGDETDDLTSRRMQADAIAGQLNPLVDARQVVVLAGDFNAKPRTEVHDRLHRVTRSDTVGDARFWEGDQTYECTSAEGVCRGGRKTMRISPNDPDKKLDYVYWSYRRVAAKLQVTFKTLGQPTSAHFIAVSTAPITAP